MKYKLIKTYPGSPELDFEKYVNNAGTFIVDGKDINPESYLEFWQKVIEKDYEILEYKTESGISCKAPFLLDSHQFYINERCRIHSIKRIIDDLVITVNDDVSSKSCNVLNKVLSIELINNKIRLYLRNSYYNLKDILKVEKNHYLQLNKDLKLKK